jgi:acetoacetate decarboxylase
LNGEKMKIDQTKLYMMPHIMGPQYEKNPLPNLSYPQSENIVIQYKTNYDAARRLVPDCYLVDQKPTVTVLFGYHNGLEFLAGSGYSLATFWISVKFIGEENQVEGDYVLIMFENQTMPILGGREFLGVPKLYANIPPIKIMPNGSIRCEASLWGHLLFGIELPQLKKQNRVVKAVVSKQINSRPWLAYKYIPSLDGPPDADYPTTTRNDVRINELWMGKQGKLYFGSPSEDDISTVVNVIEALKSLEITKVERVLHFQGSAVLRFDQSHRLK